MLAALLGDQAQFLEPSVRTGEIRYIDLHVMAVERPFRCFSLAKHEVLPGPDHDARAPSLTVIDEIGARAQDLAVEAGDPRRGAGGHGEVHIGHAERGRAEPVAVGRVAMDAIAPRRDGLDAIVALAEIEAGALERLAPP